MILCMRYGTFPTHVNLIRCFNNSKKSINWRNVALQEVNNCRWFSCLITQRLLRELPPISVTKLWGSMFTRFLIKEVKKNLQRLMAWLGVLGVRISVNHLIIKGKGVWHWQLIACIVNLILSTYLLSIYIILSIEEKNKNEALTFPWFGQECRLYGIVRSSVNTMWTDS